MNKTFRPLLNHRVYAWSDSELLSAQIDTQFMSRGYGAIIQTDTPVSNLDISDVEESVLVVAFENLSKAQGLMNSLAKLEAIPAQIIWLTDEKIKQSVLFLSGGVTQLHFNIKKTSTGPKIEMEDIVSESERVATLLLQPVYTKSHRFVADNGALAMIAKITNQTLESIQLRAEMTLRLASEANITGRVANKAIRLSWYVPLFGKMNEQEITNLFRSASSLSDCHLELQELISLYASELVTDEKLKTLSIVSKINLISGMLLGDEFQIKKGITFTDAHLSLEEKITFKPAIELISAELIEFRTIERAA